jgi:glutamine synthetase
VTDAQEVLSRLDSEGIEHLWVIWHDYSGRSCTKMIPREKFPGIFENGVVFARADLGFNLQDHMAAGSTFTADTGDFLAVPDPDSYAPIPYRERMARMYAFMQDEDGSPWEACPRTQLQRMVEAYAAEGLSVRASFESEFILFEPTQDGEYRPAGTEGMFTVAGLDRHYPLCKLIIESLHAMSVSVEQLGKEYGPGQYEATTRYDEPMEAADDFCTFKEVVRALARDAGWVASFMPKPYADMPGCGLHVHLSVWDAEGKRELSIGESEEDPLSPLGRHFLGGLLAHAAALTAIGAPLVNSYKRLLPGSWAPAHVCWGVGNRSALVRIPSMWRRRHLEFRSGDCACNPFIFMAALMGAGFDGIRNQIEPPPPVNHDVGIVTSKEEAAARGMQFLPRSLPEALEALQVDEVVADAIGPTVHSEFLKVKRSELAAYDLHVHPWERRMYLETI